MRGVVFTLFSTFGRICLFRIGPQDLPRSTALLLVATLANASFSLLIYQLEAPFPAALFKALLKALLEVAVLHARHVGEVVVLLGGIVVQVLDDRESRGGVDEDRGLAPDDLGAPDRRAEAFAQAVDRRVHGAAAMRDRLGRAWRLALCRAPGDDGLERGAHSPDLVWGTELPKGSESSSIIDGGM